MPIKINNAQSINNDGHGFSFANRVDVELNSPLASDNKGNGFHFEGEVEDIVDLIARIKEEVKKLTSVDEQGKVELYNSLDNLLSESKNPNSSKEFIKKSLSTMKDFSAKVVGSGVGALALELIKLANEHWHLLQ